MRKPRHPSQRRKVRPPRGALIPPPQWLAPAPKSMRCVVGYGPRHPQPPRPKNKGIGPRLQA